MTEKQWINKSELLQSLFTEEEIKDGINLSVPTILKRITNFPSIYINKESVESDID